MADPSRRKTLEEVTHKVLTYDQWDGVTSVSENLNVMSLAQSPAKSPTQKEQNMTAWVGQYDRQTPDRAQSVVNEQMISPRTQNSLLHETSQASRRKSPGIALVADKASAPKQSVHASILTLDKRRSDYIKSQRSSRDVKGGTLTLPNPELIEENTWLTESLRIMETDLARFDENSDTYLENLRDWEKYWKQTFVFGIYKEHFRRVAEVKDWHSVGLYVAKKQGNRRLGIFFDESEEKLKVFVGMTRDRILRNMAPFSFRPLDQGNDNRLSALLSPSPIPTETGSDDAPISFDLAAMSSPTRTNSESPSASQPATKKRFPPLDQMREHEFAEHEAWVTGRARDNTQPKQATAHKRLSSRQERDLAYDESAHLQELLLKQYAETELATENEHPAPVSLKGDKKIGNNVSPPRVLPQAEANSSSPASIYEDALESLEGIDLEEGTPSKKVETNVSPPMQALRKVNRKLTLSDIRSRAPKKIQDGIVHSQPKQSNPGLVTPTQSEYDDSSPSEDRQEFQTPSQVPPRASQKLKRRLVDTEASQVELPPAKRRGTFVAGADGVMRMN